MRLLINCCQRNLHATYEAQGYMVEKEPQQAATILASKVEPSIGNQAGAGRAPARGHSAKAR